MDFATLATFDADAQVDPPEEAPRRRIDPGRRTLTERLPVQRRAIEGKPAAATPRPAARAVARGDDPFGMHLASGAAEDLTAIAARGVTGAGGALPFADQIQRAFGRHGLDDVRAHSDATAAAAAGAIGARAYATGNAIAFAGAPDLHTAAHEAAHVVQQRAGVQLAGGVGEVGDAYERHADEVADRVVRGVSAEDLLDRMPGGARSGPAVQRKIEHEVRPPQPEPGIGEYVAALDEAVQRAYLYILHVPTLGAYRDLDGYTEQWAETWELHTRGTPHPMMAAHFGYAVESVTTLVYLPPAPSGLAIELQGPRGATRPDVILKRGAEDLAWLDITSSESAGHIWNKAGWDRQSFHLAEVSYPKMDTAHFNPTPNYDDKVDKDAFFRRKQFANFLKDVRQDAWRKLGLLFKAPRGGEPLIRQNTLPGKVMAKLAQHFGTAVDGPTAASVLTVLGVNPTTHCIYDSVSRARGTAFLLQHDPNLPTLEIPEQDGVPRVLLPTDYVEQLRMLEELERFGQLPVEELEPESSGQALELVEQDEQEPIDEQALVVPEQFIELNLPSLNIPIEMLEQLNQYLLQQQLSFAFEVGNGVVNTQVVIQPGNDFVPALRRVLRETRRQAKRYVPPQSRLLERRDAWRVSMGFAPLRRRRQVGGTGPRPALGGSAAPFVFTPPPFLLQLPNLAQTEQLDDTEQDSFD